MYTVVANVLAIGMGKRSDALRELPIRLLVMKTGAQAVRCLREERIDTVVSRWGLIDMPQGRLLKNIHAAKPSLPTIAFVTPGDNAQEIAARSLGVSAVLSDDIDDDYFRESVCQLLGVSTVAGFKAIGSGSTADIGSGTVHCRCFETAEIESRLAKSQ